MLANTLTKIVAVTVLGLVALAVVVRADGSRHCGSELISMMKFVCKGKFQGIYSTNNKRSGGGSLAIGRLIEAHHAEQRPFYETLPYAWEAVRRQEQLAAEHSAEEAATDRYRRSAQPTFDSYLRHDLANACCNNPCTLHHMMEYCLQTPKAE